MTCRPIIFSARMVLALLDGPKTQTRRLLKPQPDPLALAYMKVTSDGRAHAFVEKEHRYGSEMIAKPTIAVGDRLWVREAISGDQYAADFKPVSHNGRDQLRWLQTKKRDYAPSIHMPRWASRLTLVVTDVRVQRVQDISEEDARAEGVEWAWTLLHNKNWKDYRHDSGAWFSDPISSFRTLWNSIHGPDAWDENKWVSARSFDVHRCNVDQLEPRHDLPAPHQ